MDLRGQQKAERLFYWFLIAIGIVAWVVGFLQQSLLLSIEILAAGTIVAGLAVVPDWPFWNKDSLPWLKSKEAVGKKSGKKTD